MLPIINQRVHSDAPTAARDARVVDVELLDPKSEKSVGAFKVEGKPDRENLFEDTYSGIQFISDKIIEYVKSKI